jgi:formylmethanofuran dehydrogenase subunit A
MLRITGGKVFDPANGINGEVRDPCVDQGRFVESVDGGKTIDSVQWAVGLELLLLIDDPWRVFLSTDHPNGACFWRYPETVKLLMCADFRNEQIRKLPASNKNKITLPEITREYTLYEIATSTSAGPARALGLNRKGNLGVGADADIVIYNQEENIEQMFGHPRYVIKGGEVMIEDGEIRETPDGHEFIIEPSYESDNEDFLRPRFEDLYTMQFENYPVEIERIDNPEIQDCKPIQ